MTTIYHSVAITEQPIEIFKAVSAPVYLDAWLSEDSEGEAAIGCVYRLTLSDTHVIKAAVTCYDVGRAFELHVIQGDDGWRGSTIRFEMTPELMGTRLSFFHFTQWIDTDELYGNANFGWASSLSLLKHYLEHGELAATAFHEESLTRTFRSAWSDLVSLRQRRP